MTQERDGYRDWQSSEDRATDGAVSSRQGVETRTPVVPASREGALRLSTVYWREVERSMAGTVRPRRRGGGIELQVAGFGPVLLRFGPPEVTLTDTVVACAHPIEGGLLCRRPGGRIWFEQRIANGGVCCVSGIDGFYPMLAARPDAPAWTGELYKRVQSRLHVAVSRRYFARLVREAGR
jgi:hypothetical protein